MLYEELKVRALGWQSLPLPARAVARGRAGGMYHRLLAAEDGTDSEAEFIPAIGQGWDATPDLERFLTSFYKYFELGGFKGVLAIHISQLVALSFTILFSFFLLFLVDWEALLSCDSKDTCRTVPLVRKNFLSDLGLFRSAVFLSFLLFLAYWLCTGVATYNGITDAFRMRSYYKDRLGIYSDDVLRITPWSEVVDSLIRQQRISPFCIVQDQLTALEVANIVMREDNFLVAFANHGTFTARLPRWVPARVLFTRAVLWNLRFTIFRSLFDARSRVRRDFLQHPELLSRRLRMMGVFNLVLLPPVLMFVTIYFFMRHAEEFRSHRASPFERQWTDYAQWTFREYNELPHQFRARLLRAQSAAEAFAVSARPASPLLTAVQRCVKFIAGSILAVLLGVALWDEALLFVRVQDKNLLWYLGFFGFVFGVADNAVAAEDAPSSLGALASAARADGTRLAATPGRSASRNTAARTPSKSAASSSAGLPDKKLMHMHAAFMLLVRCTHYLPPSWRPPTFSQLPRHRAGTRSGTAAVARQHAESRRHFERVRSEFFSRFFLLRIQVLFEELLGVVLTPILLLFCLPTVATDIIELVRRARYESPNLGDWCTFGCLDPARNGSEFYGGGAEDSFISRCGAGQETFGGALSSSSQFAYFDEELLDGNSSRDILVSNGGKLEKSVISFLHGHRLQAARVSLATTTQVEPRAVGSTDAETGWARWPPPEQTWTGNPVFSGSNEGADAECREAPDASWVRSRAGGTAQELVEWHAEGPPSPRSETQARPPSPPAPQDHCLGEFHWCPPGALRLLNRVETFCQEELRNPQGAARDPVYLAHVLGSEVADEDAEAEAAGCGVHFFWIEALHDFLTEGGAL